MGADLASDVVFLTEVWNTDASDLVKMVGAVLVALPYVVLWLLLLVPLVRGSEPRNRCCHAAAWVIGGVPFLVGVDVSLFTVKLFSDLEDTENLVYYERLRMIAESFFEVRAHTTGQPVVMGGCSHISARRPSRRPCTRSTSATRSASASRPACSPRRSP